jgi:hypothetical protein
MQQQPSPHSLLLLLQCYILLIISEIVSEQFFSINFELLFFQASLSLLEIAETLQQPGPGKLLAIGAVVLSPGQKAALKKMSGLANCFISGVAGSGKSTVVNEFRRGAGAQYDVVASTGLAALLVSGRTFHSFFGLGILEGGPQKAIERAVRNRKVQERVLNCDGVIIDEISMISGELFCCADEICRAITGNKDAPWGGVKIIAVGDFAQLPPISKDKNKIRPDFAFHSRSWMLSDFQNFFFTKVHRTADIDYLSVLNEVRNGKLTQRNIEWLKSKCTDNPPEDIPHLLPRRSQVDSFNRKKLADLPGTAVAIETTYQGDEKLCLRLLEDAPIPKTLYLKPGALVIMRANDSAGRWVNGSVVTIKKIAEEVITVIDTSGRELMVEKFEYKILGDDREVIALVRNFPMTLGWAMTIHKSQGCTLDAGVIDLGGLFDYGQGYVALSRFKSPGNLYIRAFNRDSILASSEVMEFYRSITSAEF